MQLYSGSSTQFIEDSVQNRVAGKLKAAFFDYYRYQPSDNEVRSWHNSLNRMKDVLQRADLMDHGVMLEYQLPLTSKRLDCMITGKDGERSDNAVIVELKQWDRCEPAEGENEVVTWVGGANRCVLHPSVQVGQYAMYIRDNHTAFHEEGQPVKLGSCSYLHNCRILDGDPLKAPKFREAVLENPMFSVDDIDPLCGFLTKRLERGDGMPVLSRIQNSKFRASKKLLQHVSAIIEAQPVYTLLDEQLVVYDEVFAAARKGSKTGKTVLLVRGGPGTGKSVIAINLMADLSKEGFNCHYATGSRAFTTTLRKIVGARAGQQFKYFNSYATAQPNEIDVLVLDESHRIRASSVSRYTPRDARTGLPQIEEIINAANVSVFFIDDLQGIKPAEVGSSELIRSTAQRLGCEIKEYELEAQFRCSGSDAFVNWIDNTLGLRKTANILWKANSSFDFKLFDSPQELENAIRTKVADGHSARMTAGYCWPWTKDPKADGALVDDVIIENYRRPWNARPEATHLAHGIPKATLWAHEPGGIDQVGCIYTAQGFEFDYVGVIFGKDLIYDPRKAAWTGIPEESKDNDINGRREKFMDLVQKTYRVLLSRGMKGCYVHFMDENTKNFFMSRIEKATVQEEAQPTPTLIEILTDILESARFVTHLPIYGLAAAAGGFSEEQLPRPLGWVKADIGRKLASDMFVAKVKGRSMEPLILDGSYCVFRSERGGSRDGKIVLVEYSGLQDPDTGMRYTVKKYRSEKENLDDGSWRHKRIVLSSLNSEYKDIVLTDVPGHAFRVSAEFVACLA